MTDSHTGRLESALAGRYKIRRKLGEGGMASVYLAEDVKHERNVALKILKPELAAVIGADRFLAEIKTTANLQHPHILPLFDSGEADGFLYYVMPYIEGEWTTPTATTSSTATSSRRISCCTTVAPWSRTSASRWPSARPAAAG
jgi:serine/threonine protein kinase